MTDQTPATEAGRRLFTDNEPMDMMESNGVTWDDILAIEAEARAYSMSAIVSRTDEEEDEYQRGRADALREAADAVELLDPNDARPDPTDESYDGGFYTVIAAVLAILDPQP